MNRSRRKTDASDLLAVDAAFAAVGPVATTVAAPVMGTVNASRPDVTLRLTSAQIFGGALEVQIDHHGTLYRLKQTALGKLILTK